MTDLDAWLAAEEARPFEGFWGRQDCLLFMADWVEARTGRDPAARWRGRYATQTGAVRLILRAGGLTGLVREGLDVVGWREAPVPRRGQIGLVKSASWGPRTKALRQAGAVCLGGGWWAGRSPEGDLITARAEPEVVWGPYAGRVSTCRRR